MESTNSKSEVRWSKGPQHEISMLGGYEVSSRLCGAAPEFLGDQAKRRLKILHHSVPGTLPIRRPPSSDTILQKYGHEMPIGVKKVIVGRLGLFGEHCIIIGYLHQALFGSWWRYMGRIRLCKRRGISLRN